MPWVRRIVGVVLVAVLLVFVPGSEDFRQGVAARFYSSGGCDSMLVRDFDSDFGGLGISQYESAINQERITVVRDPTGIDRSVLRMKVNRRDSGPTVDSRAQISTPRNILKPCSEFWASVSLYVTGVTAEDQDEIARANGHIMFSQINGFPWKGVAPLRIGWAYDRAEGRHTFGVGAVSVDQGLVRANSIWRIDPIQDRWIDIVLHMKLSPSAVDGFVEVYANTGDGLKKRELAGGTTRYKYATLNSVNYAPESGRNNYMDLNVYRPARMNVEWVEAYFAYNRIGNSLRDVYNPNESDGD